MSITNNYTKLATIVNHINNPNLQTGTLIEEIPTDIGRSWAGYKRGGIIEGAEKMRKELMSAIVWLFGIPTFNKIGNMFCENVLKIPMNIDYSNALKGRDSIRDSIQYIADGTLKDKSLDVSELQGYVNKYRDKFKSGELDVNSMVKKVSTAKQVSSITALVLNCAMMGFILPKVNYAITNKILKKEKSKSQSPEFDSMQEFMKNTKKNKDNNNIPFTGKIKAFCDFVTYNVGNNNKFRLIATDVPMIGGRVATARNKYDALENAFMDGASIYFYNFCKGHVEKGLRKLTHTPLINPIVAEIIGSKNNSLINKAIKNLSTSEKEIKTLHELFEDKSFADEIYKQATYGKYGKINRFVKDTELQEIDLNVNNFLRKLKESNGNYSKVIKSINQKNGAFLALGLLTSILGLAVIIPKLTFLITQKLTGKNVFAGITDYSKEQNKTKK